MDINQITAERVIKRQYNTIMNERRNGGYYNVAENKKYAERAIMSMIDKMNPLDISKETKDNDRMDLYGCTRNR